MRLVKVRYKPMHISFNRLIQSTRVDFDKRLISFNQYFDIGSRDARNVGVL